MTVDTTATVNSDTQPVQRQRGGRRGLPPSCAKDATLKQKADWDYMVAKKLLTTSVRFEQIERNCRDTNIKFDNLGKDCQVKGDAYTTAADTIQKWLDRPNLVNVWELSAPRLYKCAEEGMTLYPESSQNYIDKLGEKIRMEMIYDAVKRLKEIEAKRPIKIHEIQEQEDRVRVLAEEQYQRYEALEERRDLELKKIGDGSEYIPEIAELVKRGRETGCMVLKNQGFKVLCDEVFEVEWMELLDVEDNELTEIPSLINKCSKMKKMYFGGNKLKEIPVEIFQLHKTIQVIGLRENPLEPRLLERYLEGVTSLLGYLEEVRKERRREAIEAAQRMAQQEAEE